MTHATPARASATRWDGLILAAYLRTSGLDNGDSLANQREACERAAAERGHTVAAVYDDDGLSGRLGPDARPGLAAALADVEDGAVEGVIVHRLDRLARELHVQEAVLARIWDAGGTVFEAVEGGEVQRDDASDPMRRFVRQVMGAAAELERGMITARLQAGRRRKSAQGGYIGGRTVPLGKRIEDDRVVDDPSARPVIDRAAELRRQGLSLAKIAAALNAEGHRGRDGGQWYAMGVRRLLERESRAA